MIVTVIIGVIVAEGREQRSTAVQIVREELVPLDWRLEVEL